MEQVTEQLAVLLIPQLWVRLLCAGICIVLLAFFVNPMLLGNPAGYGKPQACTADAPLHLGAGGIHTVEAFKDLLLVFLGNADAVIR